MSWVSKLFGLERDLDSIALKDLEEMTNKLGSLHNNLNHLKIILGTIITSKRAGRRIKDSVRENLFGTLRQVKRALLLELELEEEVVHAERRQERRERVVIKESIRMSSINSKTLKNPYKIGSSNECDLRILGLNGVHVLIYYTKIIRSGPNYNMGKTTHIVHTGGVQIKTGPGSRRDAPRNSTTSAKKIELFLSTEEGLIAEVVIN